MGIKTISEPAWEERPRRKEQEFEARLNYKMNQASAQHRNRTGRFRTDT